VQLWDDTVHKYINAGFPKMLFICVIFHSQEIVVTVVHRLRHWPVSVVFDQWREFTSRQREFKNLTTQMISIHQELAVKQHYSAWLKQFQAMKMAKQHHVIYQLFVLRVQNYVAVEMKTLTPVFTN
jgi:hypothetical protein